MLIHLPSRWLVCSFLLFFVLRLTASPIPPDSLSVETEFQFHNALLRSTIVEKAKDYIGLRYKYGGSTPETGFDCSGFTSYVLNMFNVNCSRSSRAQALDGPNISLEETQPGDLIVFRRSKSRPVSHVAMVVANNEEGLFIIHSCSRGVVIENLNKSRYWKPKIYKAVDVLSSAYPTARIPLLASLESKEIEPLAMQEVKPETFDMLSKILTHAHALRW